MLADIISKDKISMNQFSLNFPFYLSFPSKGGNQVRCQSLNRINHHFGLSFFERKYNMIDFLWKNFFKKEEKILKLS